tara:strand:+ start:7795 stop:8352 length:558 start_codon:yes stop_codon:yes gene_type:complete
MRKMQRDCHKCNTPIPIARLKILPETIECVECSSTEQNMVRTIITGKTTYSEIEVIKNKDTKEYLQRLEGKGRTGFGSMLYRGSRNEGSSSKISLDSNIRQIPLYTKEHFEKALREAVIWLDHDKQYAIEKVTTALDNESISGSQYRQILEILEVMSPTEVRVKKEVKQESVDEEIVHAFRNWKR